MKKNNLKINKFAIVTGASKGLGFAYCQHLLNLKFNIIGVARDTSSLKNLQENYPNQKVLALNLDLSIIENCYKLFEIAKNYNVELIVNNAGFGVWGYFHETDLTKELNMIDLNVKSLHILTKLFVQRFIKSNRGRVINISSLLAPFTPAPVFSSYYASKAYVQSLSVAVNYELKKSKTNVRVISICPGLLKTQFWKRSGDNKTKQDNCLKGNDVNKFAKKSLNKALKTKKNYLIIGLANKMAKTFTKIIFQKISLNLVYNFQRKR